MKQFKRFIFIRYLKSKKLFKEFIILKNFLSKRFIIFSDKKFFDYFAVSRITKLSLINMNFKGSVILDHKVFSFGRNDSNIFSQNSYIPSYISSLKLNLGNSYDFKKDNVGGR